jgi:hypothetical protein
MRPALAERVPNTLIAFTPHGHGCHALGQDKAANLRKEDPVPGHRRSVRKSLVIGAKNMKAFIAAVLVAAILAIAAGTTLNEYVQKTSTDAYLEPSVRL